MRTVRQADARLVFRLPLCGRRAKSRIFYPSFRYGERRNCARLSDFLQKEGIGQDASRAQCGKERTASCLSARDGGDHGIASFADDRQYSRRPHSRFSLSRIRLRTVFGELQRARQSARRALLCVCDGKRAPRRRGARGREQNRAQKKYFPRVEYHPDFIGNLRRGAFSVRAACRKNFIPWIERGGKRTSRFPSPPFRARGIFPFGHADPFLLPDGHGEGKACRAGNDFRRSREIRPANSADRESRNFDKRLRNLCLRLFYGCFFLRFAVYFTQRRYLS